MNIFLNIFNNIKFI